jgi:class 3 adenylate cyclase
LTGSVERGDDDDMAQIQVRNLSAPDETLDFPGITVEQVELGDVTVGRITLEPGWRWYTHVRPHVGGEWCQARHVGVVLSGRFGVVMQDGTTVEFGPDDVFEIPPGHDGFTIGEAPSVQIEWTGLRAFTGYRFTGTFARSLVTLLFTDLVESTPTVHALGDAAWRDLLSTHFEAVRAQLERHNGREVKTTGDGVLATFAAPANALRCAAAIRRVTIEQGLHVRAGVHVGEVEIVGGDVRGVAVHEASRILAEAGPDEILVSETTYSLAGSGHAFEDRGLRELKGLPGEWRLFAYVGRFDGPPHAPAAGS